VLDFRWQVKILIPKSHKCLEGPLKVYIKAFPPDKRRRDIDNICKQLIDSLEVAKVFVNDNQICDLHVVRCAVEKPGRVEVTIEEI